MAAAYTIDAESRQREKIAVDINYSGNRYQTENGLYTFPAPELATIDKHLYFLLANSQQKEFEQKYSMRPDYLSYDEYQTVALAFMLMYINNVPSIEEFNLDTVVVPSISAVVDMLQDKFIPQPVDELFEVNW
jgi:hypothetical protein